MKKRLAGHILFFLTGLTLLGASGARASESKLIAFAPIDEFKLRAELPKAKRGTIVNLWASWCEPCKREMPELLKYAAQQRAKGLQLFLISADTTEETRAASDVLAKMKYEPPVYILADAPDVFMKPFIENWPAVVPTTLLFDAAGKRVAYWQGELKMKELEAAVAKLGR